MRSRSRPMDPSVWRCRCVVRTLFRAARCRMPVTAGSFPWRMRPLSSRNSTSRVQCRPFFHPEGPRQWPCTRSSRTSASTGQPGCSSARSTVGDRGDRCVRPAPGSGGRGPEFHGCFETVHRELWAWIRDDADRMWSWRPETELDAAACFPERMRWVPVLWTPGRRPTSLYAILERTKCCSESITMTIPCPIFRLRPVYWLILALSAFFFVTVAVHAEQVFSSDTALIPAMWLGSMALVLGIRDRSLFYFWMAGWMFAGLWLVLQAAHLVWPL